MSATGLNETVHKTNTIPIVSHSFHLERPID